MYNYISVFTLLVFAFTETNCRRFSLRQLMAYADEVDDILYEQGYDVNIAEIKYCVDTFLGEKFNAAYFTGFKDADGMTGVVLKDGVLPSRLNVFLQPPHLPSSYICNALKDSRALAKLEEEPGFVPDYLPDSIPKSAPFIKAGLDRIIVRQIRNAESIEFDTNEYALGEIVDVGVSSNLSWDYWEDQFETGDIAIFSLSDICEFMMDGEEYISLPQSNVIMMTD